MIEGGENMFELKEAVELEDIKIYNKIRKGYYVIKRKMFKEKDCDDFDYLKKTKHYLIIYNGIIIGVVRMIFGPPFPHAETFVIPEHMLKKKIAEATRFIILKKAKTLLTFQHFVRLLIELVEKNKVDYLIVQLDKLSVAQRIHKLFPDAVVLYGEFHEGGEKLSKHKKVWLTSIDRKKIEQSNLYERIKKS